MRMKNPAAPPPKENKPMNSPVLSLPQPSRSTPFRNATRIQESLTSRIERKALVWLAARMPAWINSDHLTALGFAATLLAGASYAWARWNSAGLVAASLFLALNWLGDSLDGSLARYRNRQRPRYGFYVDHMTDSIGVPALMIGLGASSYVDRRIAVGMLVAFLLLSIESYLASYTLGIFRLSFWKFGPTEIRILLAAGNVALWFEPSAHMPFLGWRLFDFGGGIAIIGMTGVLAAGAARHTMRLYSEETLP
jgi:phosphatidylglycerophosphate synthase